MADLRTFLIRLFSPWILFQPWNSCPEKSWLEQGHSGTHFPQQLLPVPIKCWNHTRKSRIKRQYLYNPSLSPFLLVFRAHKVCAHTTEVIFGIHWHTSMTLASQTAAAQTGCSSPSLQTLWSCDNSLWTCAAFEFLEVKEWGLLDVSVHQARGWGSLSAGRDELSARLQTLESHS